jgi:hypothetical protein
MRKLIARLVLRVSKDWYNEGYDEGYAQGVEDTHEYLEMCEMLNGDAEVPE